MRIKKSIELGVDIHNPISVFSDPDNLLQILAARFTKRCFRGCYIESVDRILRKGECVITQDGSPKYGTIPVIVEVTAHVFAPGEVITGCLVQNKDAERGMVICSTQIASIMLTGSKALESITDGQLITVRVGGCRYNPGAERISVQAIPYLFTNRAIVYRLDADITPDDIKTSCADVLARIEEELRLIEKIKQTQTRAWESFDELLYAYKQQQPPPAGSVDVDLVECARSGKLPPAVKYIARDPRVRSTTSSAVGYNDMKFPDGYVQNFVPTGACVLVILLEDYCSALRVTREHIEVYSTEQLMMAHRNLWQLFKKSKF